MPRQLSPLCGDATIVRVGPNDHQNVHIFEFESIFLNAPEKSIQESKKYLRKIEPKTQLFFFRVR